QTGQLWIHEHELGREAPYEGFLIDEINSPQLWFVIRHAESLSAHELSARGPGTACPVRVIGTAVRAKPARPPRRRRKRAPWAGGPGAACPGAISGQWFAALGVGVVLTLKSAELSPVSCPSGSRTSLDPGAAEFGGAG